MALVRNALSSMVIWASNQLEFNSHGMSRPSDRVDFNLGQILVKRGEDHMLNGTNFVRDLTPWLSQMDEQDTKRCHKIVTF